MGKSNEYELILVEYKKPTPPMSGITQGKTVKVLARVGTYQKRKNAIGMPVGVLQFARIRPYQPHAKKDFFHTTSPEKQLYKSWEKDRLFYRDSTEEISAQYPAEPKMPAAPARFKTS